MKRNEVCPKCGELKVNSHKLDNGTYGVWCDSCLSGIPTRTLRSRMSEKQAWDDYEFYKHFYFGKKVK